MSPIPMGVNGFPLPGLHWATEDDIAAQFGGTSRKRMRLTEGLRRVCHDLRACHGRTLVLGGSYTSAKLQPSDFDGLLIDEGIDPNLLLEHAPAIAYTDIGAMKANYGGEIFVTDWHSEGSLRWQEFFGHTREGDARGLVAIDLTIPCSCS